MQTLGVPYEDGYEEQALDDLKAQANLIVDGLKTESIDADPNQDIIALIAYLQRLGTDIKVQQTASKELTEN
jgi:cytochrome c oxidase cbb3-type subunit I/II